MGPYKSIGCILGMIKLFLIFIVVMVTQISTYDKMTENWTITSY